MEKTAAIIVAAGASRRMGFDKLRADLLGMPVLARTVASFETCPEVHAIVLVVSDANLAWARRLVADFAWRKVTGVCQGGERRQDSVLRGIEQVRDCRWAMIHDGARPLVDRDVIVRGIAEARATGAAIAAVPVKDTIKLVDDQRFIVSTPDRAALWAAQTPQVFRLDLIVEAYRRLTTDVTDDAQVLEEAGMPVKVYIGAYDNIKITTPEDLDIATVILRKRAGTPA